MVRQQYQESQPKSDNVLQQCENLLQQMAMEARTETDSEVKRERMVCVKACKSQLQALRLESDRQSLLSSSSSSAKQLTNTEKMLARQNETLERARQSMQETENVGTEITQELQSNRATIESAHGQVQEVSSMTDRAGEILKSMSKPWWRP